jgi:hypothetical protein
MRCFVFVDSMAATRAFSKNVVLFIGVLSVDRARV